MKGLKGNAANLTALVTLVALSLLIVGCSPSETDSTMESQDFEPEYIGGYPTEETADAMFEEYDYQAAVQFYIWGYAYLNGLGFDKGMAKHGGDERSVYIWNNRVQGQHAVMTANGEVVYNCTFPRFRGDAARGSHDRDRAGLHLTDLVHAVRVERLNT